MGCLRPKGLSLPGLAGGISPISFGLACGLVSPWPCDPSRFGILTRLCLGHCCSNGRRLLFGCRGFQAGALFKLQSVPFGTTCFTSFNK